MNRRHEKLRSLGLAGRTGENLRLLKWKFVKSGRKSSQGNASPRKGWPNGVATSRYLRVRLART